MPTSAAYDGPRKVVCELSASHAAALIAAGQATGRKPSELASALLAVALESVKERTPEPSPWARRRERRP